MVDPAVNLVQVLQPVGLAWHAERLAAHSIKTCQHLLECTELDLAELGNMTQAEAKLAFVTASSAIAPPVKDMQTKLTQENTRRRLQLGVPAIDEALGGGLLNGCITEFVGGSGIGKSQFCASLAAKVCMPFGLDLHVVYIDTELKFSELRLMEILKGCLGSAGIQHGGLLQALAQRIRVHRPQSELALMNVIRDLPKEVVQRDVGMIVLDSIAWHARLDFDSSQIVARQARLAEQARMLKRLAEQHNLPVVVTNHITELAGGGPASTRAALGAVWAHAVNTRMVLEQIDGQRWIKIAKCPVAPNIAAGYQITPGGIVASRCEARTCPASSVLQGAIATEHMLG